METTKKSTEFKLYNNSNLRFGLKQRLLILIGKAVQQSIVITVDREVEVIKSELSIHVDTLLQKNDNSGLINS